MNDRQRAKGGGGWGRVHINLTSDDSGNDGLPWDVYSCRFKDKWGQGLSMEQGDGNKAAIRSSLVSAMLDPGVRSVIFNNNMEVCDD